MAVTIREAVFGYVSLMKDICRWKAAHSINNSGPLYPASRQNDSLPGCLYFCSPQLVGPASRPVFSVASHSHRTGLGAVPHDWSSQFLWCTR